MTRPPKFSRIDSSQKSNAGRSSTAVGQDSIKASPSKKQLRGKMRSDTNAAFSFARYYRDSLSEDDAASVRPPRLDIRNSRRRVESGGLFSYNALQDSAKAVMESSCGTTVQYHEDAVASAHLQHNSTLTLNKREARDIGFAASSPYARMNNATLPPDFQKNYFIEKAEEHGFFLNPEKLTQANTDAPPHSELSGDKRDQGAEEACEAGEDLHYEWRTTKSEWQKKHPGQRDPEAFYYNLTHLTKPQRIALALYLARIIAREASDPILAAENQKLAGLKQKSAQHKASRSVTSTRDSSPFPPSVIHSPQLTDSHVVQDEEVTSLFLDDPNVPIDDALVNHLSPRLGLGDFPQIRFVNAERRDSLTSNASILTLEADEINTDIQEQGEQSIIHGDGIMKGMDFLATILAPPPDTYTKERPATAQSKWTPCESWSETNAIGKLFFDTCNSYNALARQRLDAVEDQTSTLKGSVVPRLGMPVVLRGSAEAERIRMEAVESYAANREWGRYRNIGRRIVGFFKDFAAWAGTILTLGAARWSKQWDEFFKSRTDIEYRMKLMEAYAEKQQLIELKMQNADLAQKWVLDQYKNCWKGNAAGMINNPADPTGLLTAIAHTNEEDLIKKITNQLELAVEADIIAAKEKASERLGVGANDEKANILDSEYLLEPHFLREMASGIVNGVVRGIREAQSSYGDASMHQPRAMNRAVAEAMNRSHNTEY